MHNVTLKLAEPKDWPEIWAILSQPGALEWISQQADEINEYNCLQKLRLADDPTARLYSILADSNIIGVEALAQFDWQNRSAVIPLIAIREHGNGYGVQATRLLIQHAFETLNLHRVSYTSVHPKAIQRAKALGAKHEGSHRGAIWKHGQWLDRQCFAFLSKE